MKKEAITKFFERVGFKLRNHRTSWGAASNGSILLRTWHDDLRNFDSEVLVFKRDQIPSRASRPGSIERKSHLRSIWHGGLAAYTAIVETQSVGENGARSLGKFSTERVVPIERLIEDGDEILAVLGKPVEVERLAEHMQWYKVEANGDPHPEMLNGPERGSSGGWADDELQATVASYVEMMRFDAERTAYVKAHYYRELSKQFGRVEGAFERRMQNISYLLESRGMERLRGLKPQGNVGANVQPRLEGFMDEVFGELATPLKFAEELEDTAGVIEGAKQQVTVNAYERDSTAKRRCIKRWGCSCAVCGFDFHKVYGDLGKGFIHVHHLKPIHTIGEAYLLDPENDLRPVCPNCHSMLHRKKEVLSIDELRNILAGQPQKPQS